MAGGSLTVCIYCGSQILHGNCCQDCFDNLEMPDCSIGARLSSLELFAELLHQSLKIETDVIAGADPQSGGNE